jgi:hypothetical protein
MAGEPVTAKSLEIDVYTVYIPRHSKRRLSCYPEFSKAAIRLPCVFPKSWPLTVACKKLKSCARAMVCGYSRFHQTGQFVGSYQGHISRVVAVNDDNFPVLANRITQCRK